jgi:alkanesulfonate monooxygenase SsuD/methylene tetrahydromethanopterin reductase-like flavin-dependent oxidoreductase (luciferase family)
MDIGMFMVPFRFPGTDIQAGFEWDLQSVRWADEFGLSEVWFGEHFTLGWEPSCAPELYIAAAARETTQIRLATGAHLLPYHNPVALAHRLMLLDHHTGGRLMVGVGAGAYPSDAALFGVDPKDTREMMAESLDIIQRIWTSEKPTAFDGKYWKLGAPPYDEFLRGPHLRPLQQPHPPIALAGLSPNSGTLYEAGAGGYIPLSFGVASDYLAGHWYRYVEGAEAAGRLPDRNEWRVACNVFVADTDEDAFRFCVDGAMGRAFRDWLIPGYTAGGFLPIMAPELSRPEDATPEWFARNKWLVGSPDTVVEKLEQDLEISGGFGQIILLAHEYRDDPEPWRRNLELLGTEVLPRIKGIIHETEPLSQLSPPTPVAVAGLGA